MPQDKDISIQAGEDGLIGYAWSDSEFWGARGLGCAHCIDEPYIMSSSWGRLGFRCIALWFPGRTDEWLTEWLVRQHDAHTALKNNKAQKRNYNQLPMPI